MENFSGFKGVVEIKHSIEGRIRFYIPALKSNATACTTLELQLSKIEIIKTASANAIVGSLLLEHEIGKIDTPTLVGVIVKLLGLEQELEKKRKSQSSKEISNVFDAVNSGIFERTNGILDLDSLLTLSFVGVGVYSLVTKPFSLPSGINFLYWAYKNKGRHVEE